MWKLRNLAAPWILGALLTPPCHADSGMSPAEFDTAMSMIGWLAVGRLAARDCGLDEASKAAALADLQKQEDALRDSAARLGRTDFDARLKQASREVEDQHWGRTPKVEFDAFCASMREELQRQRSNTSPDKTLQPKR